MKKPGFFGKSDSAALNADPGITEKKIELHKNGETGGLLRLPRIDTDILWRVLISAGLLIFFALLQTTVFARFRPFGAVPDLMLPLVIAIGMTEREKWGAVFGIAAAFVIESLGGAPVALLALLYMPAGYLAGILTIEMFRDSFAVRLLFTAVGCAVHMLFTLAALALTVDGLPILRGLTEAVLPEFLASMVFAALPHLLAKAALRVFHKPREERVE